MEAGVPPPLRLESLRAMASQRRGGPAEVDPLRLSGDGAVRLRRIIAMNPPPAEIAHVAERIGGEATFILLERRGGSRLYIPKTVNEGRRLAREFGLEVARALSEWRGGDYLKVPLCRFWRIRIWRRCGASISVIARHFGITEHAVGRTLTLQRLAGRVQPQRSRRLRRRLVRSPSPSEGNPAPCP